MLYKHKKTGQIYRHLAVGVDTTNARDGTLVVIYAPLDDDHTIFVRAQAEHQQKFDLVTTDKA